jgi:hypothetical protein
LFLIQLKGDGKLGGLIQAIIQLFFEIVTF